MICKSCVGVKHWACEHPASCSCGHRVSSPNGEMDEWQYSPLPVVFDNNQHGWVWRAAHPEAGEVLFDTTGRKCELRFGDRGVRLFYRAVDFWSRV